MYETYTMFYDNERAMRWGIANMQKQGWEVVSVKATDQGWSRRKLAHDRRGQTTK